MRIMITNDDGILAPGLKIMEDLATELAGPNGEVWTVAPLSEQSGVGHCISYTRPVSLHSYGPRRYAVEGSPADCVLAGVHQILPEKPDLVLSGVNRGNNSAENTLYSGTIGAAIEAALAGIPSIALSQFMGPRTHGLDNIFEASAQHGVAAVRACLKAGFERRNDYAMFYNVNFPPTPGNEVLGLKAVAQGYRRDQAFTATPTESPQGRMFLFLHGRPQQTPTAPGTDAHANIEGYVSITPMRADLTAHDYVDTLKDALSDDT